MSEEPRPLRLVGYVRVSTDSQAEHGFGIDVQERLIRDWVKHHRARLHTIKVDAGVSGRRPFSERPALLELMIDHLPTAHGIIVTSLDRLARDLLVQEAILAELWKHGKRVYAVDGGLVAEDDPDEPMRKMIRQVMGAMAEFERATIVKRMRAGRAAKKARGLHAHSRAPYGFRSSPSGTLVPYQPEQKVIEQIRAWREYGHWSWRRIARTLNEQGVPTRERGEWHASTVARALGSYPKRRKAVEKI